MGMELKERFLSLWTRYFGAAQLPICLFYSGDAAYEALLRPIKGRMCMVGQLANVFKGEDLAFTDETIGCPGGRRYLGFNQALMPNFDYFLSCGIPGQLEGERYKKSPELVSDFMKNVPAFSAPARYAVFKRWDKLSSGDIPEVVIFFSSPDVLSGLFTLAGFDEKERNSVVAPFGAGCATIAQYPILEGRGTEQRAVLGMFDVSARPFLPAQLLSFTVPMAKFERMVNNMDESFLITESWTKVKGRIEQTGKGS